jgi:ribose-phosphate pyrophosphokinase
MGGAKRANSYAKSLTGEGRECGVIICHKTRERANVVSEIKAIGDVEGKNIIIVDDMIDTAGTLCKAADVLKDKGASSVRCCATHGILSGNALERIHESSLDEVFITDTIPHPELEGDSKIRVVSMSPVFASIIDKVYNYEPISPGFVY